jgi:hypothetical protein
MNRQETCFFNFKPIFAECDVNCHKKCEKLAANLCGVNQKLIVEALASVRRENQGAYMIEKQGFLSFAFRHLALKLIAVLAHKYIRIRPNLRFTKEHGKQKAIKK